MTATYFDTLPKELILIIISKLNPTDTHQIGKVSYPIKKILQDDLTYGVLLRISDPSFYNFFINVKNLDGCTTWKDAYRYHIGLISYDSYNKELHYLYQIYRRFPQVYPYLKNINLAHEGFKLEVTPTWGQLLKMLNMYKDQKFIKGLFTYESFKEISIKTMTHFGTENPESEVIFFDIVIAFIAYSSREYLGIETTYVSLDILYKAFLFNTDMYEIMLHQTDIQKLLSNPKLSAIIERFIKDRSDDYVDLFQMFMEDLKSRV
jgi:hypothetical protein